MSRPATGEPVSTTRPPSAAVKRVLEVSLRVPQPQSSADLVSLALGEPDDETPLSVRIAAKEAIDNGHTHYAPPYGLESLRSAIADRVETVSGRFSREQVLITHGCTAGLAAAIIATVDPGDRVVMPDPTYSLYADLVRLVGGVCVPVPVAPDLHWDLVALRQALAGAKVFIFCNPCNPTGVVHRERELAVLADSDVIVLADEAYSELVYGDEPFVSALHLPYLASRTLYLQTFSKSYAMTGWRLGYVCGPTDLMAPVARVHFTLNGPVNTFVQQAALTALDADDAVRRMRDVYLTRRDWIVSALAAIPQLSVPTPDGAFYAFPSYDIDLPSVELVARLRKFGVAVRAGREFGVRGEGALRISYSTSEATLEEGVRRLAAGLASI